MGKIESLTPEQEAAMITVRDKWIKIGLCTDPANRPEAERGVVLAYEAAKLPPPEHYIWLDSPLAGMRAAWLLKENKSTPATIKRDAYEADFSEATTTPAVYSQHDANWLSFYDFFASCTTDELREKIEPLRGLMTVAQNAGWWWPFERAVILTERHCTLHVEPNPREGGGNRLHCIGGPALAYPDGYSIWYVHGVEVPQRVAEKPHTITATQVLAEQNTEVRRIMIELMGMERFVDEADAKCIDDDERWGRLLKIDLIDDEPVVLVDLRNSTCDRCGIMIRDCSCVDPTRKRYLERVPPTTATCLEGLAWRAGTSMDKYATVMAES